MTLTSDETVGCNVLDKRRASHRLNRLHHFWSGSAIFVSVELLPEDFLVLEHNLSFFTFFSGGTDEEDRDLTDSFWPTTPMTETLDRSTSSEDSWMGVADSASLASRFSFFNLYEGVEI